MKKLGIKGYILIAVIVFLAMSMSKTDGNGGGSALGTVWANEMATSDAILNESAANCKDVLTKTSFGCGGIFR